MVTAQQAEQIAITALQTYVDECQCENDDDLRKVLIKSFSINAQMLVATQGIEGTKEIIDTTKAHIIQKNETWTQQKVH